MKRRVAGVVLCLSIGFAASPAYAERCGRVEVPTEQPARSQLLQALASAYLRDGRLLFEDVPPRDGPITAAQVRAELDRLTACGVDWSALGAPAAVLAAARPDPAGPAVLQALVELGLPLDRADAQGRTALMSAAVHGRAEAMQFLLARGATLSERDAQGRGPVYYAVESLQAPVLGYLAAEAPDALAPFQERPAVSAALRWAALHRYMTEQPPRRELAATFFADPLVVESGTADWLHDVRERTFVHNHPLVNFQFRVDYGVLNQGRDGSSSGHSIANVTHHVSENRGDQANSRFTVHHARSSRDLAQGTYEAELQFSFALDGGLYDRSFPRDDELDAAHLSYQISGGYEIPACGRSLEEDACLSPFAEITANWTSVYTDAGAPVKVIQNGAAVPFEGGPLVLDRRNGTIRVALRVNQAFRALGPSQSYSGDSEIRFRVRPRFDPAFSDAAQAYLGRVHRANPAATGSWMMASPTGFDASGFPTDAPAPYGGGIGLALQGPTWLEQMAHTWRINSTVGTPMGVVAAGAVPGSWRDADYMGRVQHTYFGLLAAREAIDGASALSLDGRDLVMLRTIQRALSSHARGEYTSRILRDARLLSEILRQQDLARVSRAILVLTERSQLDRPRLLSRLRELRGLVAARPELVAEVDALITGVEAVGASDVQQQLRAFRTRHLEFIQSLIAQLQFLTLELGQYVDDDTLRQLAVNTSWADS